MAETFVPNKTDLVRLVNNSGKAQHFSYNGNAHTVGFEKGKDSIIVTREIAEHGVKKCISLATQTRGVSIVELPESQRTTDGLSRAAADAEKAKADNERLRQENEKLQADLVKAKRK